MVRQNLIHLSHFLLLVVGLTLISFTAVTLFSNRNLQSAAIVSLCLYYFCWGIFHHYLEKTLHPRIALEYFVISLFGAVILLTVIHTA